MTLLHAITGRVWLTTDAMLQTILEIASREQHDLAAAKAAQEARREALAVKEGRPLDNARYVTVRDGVAVLEVIGPIFRYANLFTSFSGGTATELLAQDFQTALDDPGVRAILLAFDSPGGEATGIHEFADQVYAARGRKPLCAYVGGMAASAAYWIASACDEVVIDATAELGSIGAVLALPNPEAKSARQIEIVSSQSPNKRPDPTTEKGRAQYQARVDALAQVFVEDVARNRGVSTDTVLADFGQGGVLTGQAAIDAGLADRMGNYEATLAGLCQQTMPQMMRPRRAAAQEDPMSLNFKDVFASMFRAAAEVEAEQSPAAPAAPETSTQAERDALAAEVEQLRAAQAAEQAAQATAAAQARQQAAEAFAAAEIAAARAVPADADALAAVYAACDAAGCTAQLQALVASRPAHRLTTELLPADAAGVVAADPAPEAPKQMSAERRRQLLSYIGER